MGKQRGAVMKNANRMFWFYTAVLLSVIIMIVGSTLFVDESLEFQTEKAVDMNTGWDYIAPDGTSQRIALPVKLDVPAGEDVIIAKMLPQKAIAGETICIRTSMQSLQVFSDGKMLYEFGVDPRSYIGKTPGSCWNLVRIPAECAGNQIQLVFNSAYPSYSGSLNSIFYGSKSAILFRIIKEFGFGFVISVALCMLGIIMLVLYCSQHGFLLRTNDVLSLSLFAILISLWFLGESKMLQFFTGNQFVITNLSFLALLLFPMPLTLYLRNAYKPHHRNYLKSFFLGFLIVFFVCVFLQITGTADFYETLFIPNGLLLLLLTYLLVSLFYELIKYHNEQAKRQLFAFTFPILFAILEFYHFYAGNYLTISKYTKIGVLIYTVLLSIQAIRKMQLQAERGRDARYFERLAYQDFLTQGRNRTAYCHDVEEIFGGSEPKAGIRLVLFDLNNLKGINDKYGHIAGDRALKDAYGCICGAFGTRKYGYRIGGDEFACILLDMSGRDFEAALRIFRENVMNINLKSEYDFSIAIGYELYDPEKWPDFESFSHHVDELMYQDKRLSSEALEMEKTGNGF